MISCSGVTSLGVPNQRIAILSWSESAPDHPAVVQSVTHFTDVNIALELNVNQKDEEVVPYFTAMQQQRTHFSTIQKAW